MKRILLAAAIVLGMGATAMAQEDKVLMTINGETVTASEFLYIYQKNNQETTMDKKTMDEYLDLFINFKLKVAEAKAQGIDTTASFLKELSGYRAQATPKYLQDEQALDSMIQLSYAHMCRDRRAKHIAIQCPATATDSADRAARQQLEKARKQLLKAKGEKRAQLFEKLAREISTDPSVQDNGGELGWITPFRYVYSFEDAVYGTKVGEITPIFRTVYGYHIALVEEERDHEEVHAAHIMKMVPRGNDSLKAVMKGQIDSIYALLQGGADFEETARQLSDDKGSAARGGDLGWFGHGMMVRPFEDAAFSMQPGQVGMPFTSDFGWHIIKLYDRRGILPLDSIRQQVQRNVQRDERMKETDKAFIRKARAEYRLPADMSDEDVKAYADSHLEEKYPEFANLVLANQVGKLGVFLLQVAVGISLDLLVAHVGRQLVLGAGLADKGLVGLLHTLVALYVARHLLTYAVQRLDAATVVELDDVPSEVAGERHAYLAGLHGVSGVLKRTYHHAVTEPSQVTSASG